MLWIQGNTFKPLTFIVMSVCVFRATGEFHSKIPQEFSNVSCFNQFQLLLRHVAIPRASGLRHFQANNTRELLDQEFLAIIGGYSAPTQKLLRNMYFSGLNVTATPGLIQYHGAYAHWKLQFEDNTPVWRVYVAPEIMQSPLLYRLHLIHEVAIHVGQTHEYYLKFGMGRTIQDTTSLQFDRVTEMSAASVEKRILDQIPQKELDDEIRKTTPDYNLALMMRRDFAKRRNMSARDYLTLSHRSRMSSNGNLPSEEEVEAFLNAPQIER